MTRFSYMVVGDLHLDVKAPSSKRIDDYEAACFDKLNQIHNLALRYQLKLILITGDWFHRKSPSAVPHRLVNRTLEWLAALEKDEINVFTVPGNHDVQFNDFSPSGIKKQPYGVLYQAAPNLIDLSVLSGYQVDRVLFTGSRYRSPVNLLEEDLAEDVSQFAPKFPAGRFRETVDYHVHLCHASVLAESPPWKPYTLVSDLFKVTVADLVHCGHIHDYIGVAHGENALGKPCIFTNVGSLTRGARAENNIARTPEVLTVTLDSNYVPQTFRHTLDCAHASEIYDLKEYRNEKTKVASSNAWAEQLRREFGKAEIEANESFEELIAQSGALDHRTRDLARGILDEAGE